MRSLETDLREIITEKDALHIDEPMKRHTTFGVGGRADIFIDVSIDELASVMACLRRHEIPVTVVGNGSNLLVSDSGIRGAVLCIGRRINRTEVKKDQDNAMISCQAGALLPRVAMMAADQALSGLEFAAGIPGTIGGAVYMNAGAFGGDMSEIVSSVTTITEDGEIKDYSACQVGFGYRKSIFSEKNEIITGAVLSLRPGDPSEIRERIKSICDKRKKSQPTGVRSAGSTFRKAGDGDLISDLTPAWRLIQQAGMKDARVGGALVSPKHSGFVVNDGSATAGDIYQLICAIRERVKEETGVELEPEVKLLGEF